MMQNAIVPIASIISRFFVYTDIIPVFSVLVSALEVLLGSAVHSECKIQHQRGFRCHKRCSLCEQEYDAVARALYSLIQSAA